MYSVYILYSKAFDKYYIGHTNNVHKRLEEHNSVDNKSYTSKYQPWIVVCSFYAGEKRGTAMKIESFIKKQKSKLFIQKVIQDPYMIKFIAQLVRVPKSRD